MKEYSHVVRIDAAVGDLLGAGFEVGVPCNVRSGVVGAVDVVVEDDL